MYVHRSRASMEQPFSRRRAGRRRMPCSYLRACKWSGFRERFAREKRGSDSERERGSFNTSIRECGAYRARRSWIDNKTTMRSAPMRTANFLSSFARRGHFADAPLLRERACLIPACFAKRSMDAATLDSTLMVRVLSRPRCRSERSIPRL